MRPTTVPRSRSTAPGRPAVTASSPRPWATPAVESRVRIWQLIQERSRSGPSSTGVFVSVAASVSPARSATASRVVAALRTMPATTPYWALNCSDRGRRPPVDGPRPSSLRRPSLRSSAERVPTVGADRPVAAVIAARVNGPGWPIVAASTRSMFARRSCRGCLASVSETAFDRTCCSPCGPESRGEHRARQSRAMSPSVSRRLLGQMKRLTQGSRSCQHSADSRSIEGDPANREPPLSRPVGFPPRAGSWQFCLTFNKDGSKEGGRRCS